MTSQSSSPTLLQEACAVIIYQHELPDQISSLSQQSGITKTYPLQFNGEIDADIQPNTNLVIVVDSGQDAFFEQLETLLRQSKTWRLLPWIVMGDESEYKRRLSLLRRGFWEYLRLSEPDRTVKKLHDTINFYHHCAVNRHMEGWVSFRAKSEYSYIRDVNFLISRLQFMTSLSREEIEDIQYAFLEIGNNAIEHGNLGDIDKLVNISYLIFDDKLIIKVEDEGQGFKLEEVKSPVGEEQLLEGRGRGIFLVREMMDEVQFNDRGNICLMTKKFKALPDELT